MDNTTSDYREAEIFRQAARRRTFAIISHPDAGKTTLTEKLLYFANAIDLAGAVRGRKGQRRATSDWMAMEQERGISMTSSVLQFEYGACVFNLLDTPACVPNTRSRPSASLSPTKCRVGSMGLPKPWTP